LFTATQLQSQNDSANSLLQIVSQNINAMVATYLTGINMTVQNVQSCITQLFNVVGCVTNLANGAVTTETNVVKIKINLVNQLLNQVVNMIVGSPAQPSNTAIPSIQQTIQSAVCQIGSITLQATSCLLQAANATAANATTTTAATGSG
jgi:hypothetical protein